VGGTCPKHVCKDKCTAAGVAGDFHCFTLKTGDEFNLKYDDEKDAADMALALGCPGAHKMGAKWMAGAKHTAWTRKNWETESRFSLFRR